MNKHNIIILKVYTHACMQITKMYNENNNKTKINTQGNTKNRIYDVAHRTYKCHKI